jgi:hypothetical protein
LRNQGIGCNSRRPVWTSKRRATWSYSTNVQSFRIDRLDLVREVVGSNPVASTVSQTQIPRLIAKTTGVGFELLRGNGGFLWRHESRD